MTALVVTLVISAFVGWIVLMAWMVIRATEANDTLKSWVWGLGAVLVFALPPAIVISQSMEENAKPFDGYVYKKTYTPAHNGMILVGKVLVPQHYPPRWNFVLNSPEGNDQRSCDVTETTYSKVEMGEEFHCGGY
jgi:hypothetical protein